MSTSTSYHSSFPNPGQWIWCVNIETGRTRTQTIADTSEKDVTSRNQTHGRGEHGQDHNWISCRILAIFLDQDWIWIFIFEKNWMRTGSGFLFDFHNESFLRVIQDVTNDGGNIMFSLLWFLYLQKIKMILSVGYALHSSQSMIINLC